MKDLRTGLSAAEAQQCILAAASPLPAEVCATRAAQGRILAETVFATRTLPPWRISAMDGYAVRVADISAASPAQPTALPLAFEIPAGARRRWALPPGQAARIFTGAPLPPGADTVVPQEDVERRGDVVLFAAVAKMAEHVRPAGEELRRGEALLEPGPALGPAQLGLLASTGRSSIAVRQRPRVALFSSGDELTEIDGDPTPGRIVSSNSYSLAAQIRETGAEPLDLGIARDEPEALAELLRAGLSNHVLVSSAGVSVGDRDFVRPVLEDLGCELQFFGVRIKPGFPLVFGRFGPLGPLVFGLPGNPVSAMVCFELFVRPALRKMGGHRSWFRPRLRASLSDPLRKRTGRMHLMRVILARDGGRLLATSTGNQSSGVMRSMAAAQGLAIIPAEVETLDAGAAVDVLILDPDFFAAADSGLSAP